MNKTGLINKLLWLGYTSAEGGKEKRKEVVSMAHNLVDEYLEAINYTRCCKSDSEQLVCVVDYLSNFTKGKNYECKPDGKKHFEVYDDFGGWYSVHKKCFSKTELAN